jgi:DNA-binding LacI/PurR family transcriptional regulator
MSLHGEDRLPTLLADRGLPVVICGQLGSSVPLVSEDMSCVDADNAGGARAAVAHLLARGRRRVVCIAGPQDMGVGVLRLRGFREGLAQAQVRVHESLIAYGDFSEASGAQAMLTLLDRHPDLDAVFCASDLMAVGAMRTLREHGRRVPTDVAVVGFEDSVLARQTDPTLTTVHQPVEAMGREMARLLVAHIKGEKVPSTPVVLDTHLVVRASG